MSARPILLAALLAAHADALGSAPPPAPPLPAFRADAAPHSAAAQASMVVIPAGRYTLGDPSGRRDARPPHPVALDAFRIDRTEVTNAAFAEFLSALPAARPADGSGRVTAAALGPAAAALLIEGREGSGAYPLIALDDEHARIRWDGTRFAPAAGADTLPVQETTWRGAMLYCRWRGGRLPTEAEWEAAARGTEARPYPWGAARPDATRAAIGRRSGDVVPVGSRPAGATPDGLLDMAGNVQEWTSSLYRPYPWRPDDGREDPSAAGERVTRGGDHAYDDGAATLTAFHRTGFSRAPERGHRHIGFRCAADLPP